MKSCVLMSSSFKVKVGNSRRCNKDNLYNVRCNDTKAVQFIKISVTEV